MEGGCECETGCNSHVVKCQSSRRYSGLSDLSEFTILANHLEAKD